MTRHLARMLRLLQLLRGLLDGERAPGGPIFADIDVTRRCNLRCVGCLYRQPHLRLGQPGDPTRRDMSVTDFRRLCRELVSIGTPQVVLQGAGEPLLHPQITEFVAIASDAGMKVTMVSNGTLLDDDRVDGLLDAGLAEIKVSLWAMTRRQARLNYPGSPPDTHERVVAGLRKLSEGRSRRGRGCHLILSLVVNRHNLDSLEQVADLAIEAGCDELQITPMHDYRDERPTDVLTSEQRRRVVRSFPRLRRRLRKARISDNFDVAALRFDRDHASWSEQVCYAAFFHARIRVDGTMQPCGRCDDSIDFGNVLTSGFDDVWNGGPIRAFRRRALTPTGMRSIDGCRHCVDCCFARDQLRVHRFARWLSPLIGRFPSM